MMKSVLQNINVGDGSMQKWLDAGCCPRCGATLSTRIAEGMFRCNICKLQVIDKELEMHETFLMPDEKEISEVPPRMEWSEAVRTIEDVVEQWLTDPEPIGGEVEEKVRSAWQRILAG